jgi:indolepyruvate ferredoxin oxidoreductase
VRLKVTTRPWMHKIVRHFKALRLLPGWHRRDREFREWYISLLDRVDLTSEQSYANALKVLQAIDDVTGYREVRYPKMDRARRDVEQLLLRPQFQTHVDARTTYTADPDSQFSS